jgi:LysR family hydrogen peroxide-inducible transcriptional activator
MELTQVRYFLVLCRTLNFTRAAAECHVTQPAFSRAIARLEEELTGTLIPRERNSTILTELGREMRPHLQAMVDSADAVQALATSRRQPSGNLRIGRAPGISAAPIASAIAEVLRVFPSAELHFSESSAPSLAESMLADALDCALVLPEESTLPDRLNRWPLYTETAVLVCPSAHRLSRHNTCTGTGLEGEILLVGDSCGGFGKMMGDVSAPQPRLQYCRGSASQLCEMIAAGLGIALLSNRLSIAAPLITRPFTEPELTRGIQLTALAGRPLNPAAASFVKLCRAQAFS